MGANVGRAQVADADTTPRRRGKKKEPKEILRLQSTRVPGPDCCFQVPVHGYATLDGDSFRELTVGEPSNAEEKVVLLMGQTGSGKSTMTNWFLNFIYGVNYKDGYRLQVVAPSSRVESDTKYVYAYTFYHQPGMMINYTLTIVDTPGFLSTGEIDEDRAIRNRLSNYFQANNVDREVSPLHAACILVRSATTRLTAAEDYVFQCITQIFGKDIKENIMIFFTFADQLGNPPAKEVVHKANVPFEESFFFNNGDVLKIGEGGRDSRSKLSEIWWESGQKQTAAFFHALEGITARTSELTMQTLDERGRIERSVSCIELQIRSGLHTLQMLGDVREAIERNKAKIDKKQNFNFQVEEELLTIVETTDEKQATVCERCKFTCHYPCHTNDRFSRGRCLAMDLSGNCTHCPGKCKASDHATANFKYVRELQHVEKNSEDLIKMFSDAIDQIVETPRSMQMEVVIDDHFMKKALEDILNKVNDVRDSLVILEDVAMVPAPHDATEYIDMLIEKEKGKGGRGHKSRIRNLEYVKEQYRLLSSVKRG